jgi:hypothetical protein
MGEQLVDEELGIPLAPEEAIPLRRRIGFEADVGLVRINGQLAERRVRHGLTPLLELAQVCTKASQSDWSRSSAATSCAQKRSSMGDTAVRTA